MPGAIADSIDMSERWRGRGPRGDSDSDYLQDLDYDSQLPPARGDVWRPAVTPGKRTLTSMIGVYRKVSGPGVSPGKRSRSAMLPMVQRAPASSTAAPSAAVQARLFLDALTANDVKIDDTKLMATSSPQLSFAVAGRLAAGLPTARLSWRVDARDSDKEVAQGDVRWAAGSRRSPQIGCFLPRSGRYHLHVVLEVPGHGRARVGKVFRARDSSVASARSASDGELRADQESLRSQLATNIDAGKRKALVNSYNATNWVAHARGLEPKKDEEQAAGPVWRAGALPEDPAAMRSYIERTVVAVGPDKAAAAVMASLMLGWVSGEQRQLAIMALREVLAEKHELEQEVKRAAMDSAWLMVNQSTRQIGQILQSYGITTNVVDLIEELANSDADPEAVATRVIARSKGGADEQGYASKAGARAQLVAAVGELSAMRATLHGLYRRRDALEQQRGTTSGAPAPHYGHSTHHKKTDRGTRRFGSLAENPASVDARRGSPLMPKDKPPGASAETRMALQVSLGGVAGEIKRAQLAYTTRWIEAEREHPMLIAYRDSSGQGGNLGTLSGADEDAAMRTIVSQVMPKLANLARLSTYLQEGTIDPLALPPVVALTKQRLLIRPGSMRDTIAERAIEEANDDGIGDWAIAALTLGLAIITALPTAGGSLIVLAELSGLALDMYLAMETYADYTVQSGLTDTAIDPARALSSQEPSLTWLAVELVGSGLGAAFAVKTFREAMAVRRALQGADEASDLVRRLDALGNEHGLGPIGTRVASEPPGKRLASHGRWDGGVESEFPNRGGPHVDARDPDAGYMPHAYLERRELRSWRKVNFHRDWQSIDMALKSGNAEAIAIGRKLTEVENAKNIIASLARGESSALSRLGIEGVPKGLDTTGREWALAQGRDGYFIYVGHYNGMSLPSDVRLLAHTHPGPVRGAEFIDGMPQQQVRDLPAADDSSGMRYEDIAADIELAQGTGLSPSAQDIHAISDGTSHVIYTRYVHNGGGLIGNPIAGSTRSQVSIHLRQTKVVRWNTRNKELYYEVQVVVKDATGEGELWSGTMYCHWRPQWRNGNVTFRKPIALTRPLGPNEVEL